MKKRITTAALLLSLTMTGCAPIQAYFKNPTEEEIQDSIQADLLTEIQQNTDYQQYQEFSENGKLSEDGVYQDEDYNAEKAANADKEGKIHVTFAENSHLEIRYFSDKELTVPLENDCYLEPGAFIYASEPVCNNTNIATYAFDTFRIGEYDIKGERVDSYPAKYSEANVVCQLPADDSVRELSIEPLGKYVNRRFQLRASLDNGNQSITGGKWFVNDQQQMGDVVELDPSEVCNVTYEFPENLYYCIKEECSPEPQSCSDDTVVFRQVQPSETLNEFSVKLGKKIGVKITKQGASADYSIKVGGKALTKTTDLAFKPNEEVEITVSSEDMISGDLTPESVIAKGGENVYTFKIPEAKELTKDELKFTIKKQNTFDIEIKTSGWVSDNIIDPKQKDLLYVSAGDTTYNFNELKPFITPHTITVKEADKLTINVNDSIRNNPNIQFRISMNGENDQYFNKFSKDLGISRDCSGLNRVEIYLEKGYAFELSEIQKSNQEISVSYQDESGQDIAEGQFLAPGTKVKIIVSDIPAGCQIAGGAIKAGHTEGTVKINKDTKSSDFVIKYTKE